MEVTLKNNFSAQIPHHASVYGFFDGTFMYGLGKIGTTKVLHYLPLFTKTINSTCCFSCLKMSSQYFVTIFWISVLRYAWLKVSICVQKGRSVYFQKAIPKNCGTRFIKLNSFILCFLTYVTHSGMPFEDQWLKGVSVEIGPCKWTSLVDGNNMLRNNNMLRIR